MTTSTKTIQRPWLAAGLWMVFLGFYFFVVYGACNWISSLKEGVPTFYFSWETAIPFVPLMIIPYMSIDLFFAGSAFLCKDKKELHTHLSRIVFAISLSAICFLLFPLRFGYGRPEMSGWLAKLFIPLNAHDLPFNLAPSLHITLRWIIWSVYERHTKGHWRQALHIWFFLIAASTLLIYQHHVIDIIGGVTVAFLCFYLFPRQQVAEKKPSQNYLKALHRRIGLRYFLVAVFFALLACGNYPGHLIFFWPAFASLIVAMAYVENRPQTFQKRDGGIPLATCIGLAPYFIASWILHRYFRRFSATTSQIDDSLILGRRLSDCEARKMEDISAVLDMTAEFPENREFLKLPYKNIPLLDWTAPSQQQLDEAVSFIHEHGKEGTVYVHCALGLSRGACVAAAWMLAEGKAANVEDAIDLLQSKRPGVILPNDFIAALRVYHSRLIKISSGPTQIGPVENSIIPICRFQNADSLVSQV